MISTQTVGYLDNLLTEQDSDGGRYGIPSCRKNRSIIVNGQPICPTVFAVGDTIKHNIWGSFTQPYTYKGVCCTAPPSGENCSSVAMGLYSPIDNEDGYCKDATDTTSCQLNAGTGHSNTSFYHHHENTNVNNDGKCAVAGTKGPQAIFYWRSLWGQQPPMGASGPASGLFGLPMHFGGLVREALFYFIRFFTSCAFLLYAPFAYRLGAILCG